MPLAFEVPQTAGRRGLPEPSGVSGKWRFRLFKGASKNRQDRLAAVKVMAALMRYILRQWWSHGRLAHVPMGTFAVFLRPQWQPEAPRCVAAPPLENPATVLGRNFPTATQRRGVWMVTLWW